MDARCRSPRAWPTISPDNREKDCGRPGKLPQALKAEGYFPEKGKGSRRNENEFVFILLPFHFSWKRRKDRTGSKKWRLSARFLSSVLYLSLFRPFPYERKRTLLEADIFAGVNARQISLPRVGSTIGFPMKPRGAVR